MLNLLSAVATFVGTLIVTLPTIFLASAIALAGLWLINNFHGPSSLRSVITFPDGHPNGDTPSAPDRHAPDETNGGP